jgi:hypothetical protein
LLESIYVECLEQELRARGLRFVRQVTVPITYKGIEILAPVYKAQVLTYMRITGNTAGLLINFNVPRLMDGVKRLVNPAYAA